MTAPSLTNLNQAAEQFVAFGLIKSVLLLGIFTGLPDDRRARAAVLLNARLSRTEPVLNSLLRCAWLPPVPTYLYA